MAECPRIAIGTVQPKADLTAMGWALMDAMQRIGLRVQSFLSHAYFSPKNGATAITGLPPRHVDSWLMTECLCHEVFLRGCRTSDLAVVEGRFTADAADAGAVGSDFTTLCRWLDLPRLAVVDARLVSGCHLPDRPERLDGLLLDRVADAAEFCRLQTQFESLWKLPVFGWLGPLASLRREIDAIEPGCQPTLALCHALGDELSRVLQLETILLLAASRTLDFANKTLTPSAAMCECAGASQSPPLRVAVAYDHAFCGYFPDTLDLLELHGASISDFSPLRDERLPPGTDVVYVGCGHPERFAAALSQNDCLKLAIKSHLCEGKRIYAESGGLAWLCQEIELPDSQRWPMVGALPCTARFDPTRARPTPSEVRLASDTWLGCAGACWRGYLSPRWNLRPPDALSSCCAAGSGHELDVVKRHQAVGSRMYLNFAAHSELLESFFIPHTCPAGASGVGASPTV